MALISFKINLGTGFVPVDPPHNAGDTVIQRIWNNGNPSATVQAINYEWLGKTAQDLNKYRNAGLTGGTGITEGPGLQLFIGNTKFFEGCIDTANKSTLWECDRVTAPIKETGRIDWLKTTAESITFAYLRRLGMITTANYKKVPYTKTDVIDRAQLTMLFLQEIVMTVQLIKALDDITSKSATTTGGAATEVATFGETTGDLVADIINVVAEVIYIGTLVAAIVLTANQIFDQIVETKRYKYAMRVEDLFNICCAYLSLQGTPLQFSSTIFQSGPYKDVTVMPRKIVMPKNGITVLDRLLMIFERSANEVNSSKSYGHPDGTLKELIDNLGVLFNTAPVINNGKLFLEEKNSYGGNASYVLPDTGPEGYTFNYPDPHSTNAAELAAVYELVYATDVSDLNTIHEYEGTSVEVSMLPVNVINRNNLLLSGLKRKNIPYAHAKRKEFLTFAEQELQFLVNLINGAMNALISALNGIISVINGIVSTFGGNTATIPSITYLPTDVMKGRIGWMELTNDTFDIPKIFIGHDVGGDWHIHPNNKQIMSAETILNTFHVKELATRGGQWNKFGDLRNTCKIKYCLTDDLIIANNNYFTTSNGKKGKFDSVKWKPSTDTADASFGINENYTNNLHESIAIDGH